VNREALWQLVIGDQPSSILRSAFIIFLQRAGTVRLPKQRFRWKSWITGMDKETQTAALQHMKRPTVQKDLTSRLRR